MLHEDAKKELLLMPRRDRARAEGLTESFRLGVHHVVRMTRRYWKVNGTGMKLKDAIEAIAG